MKLFDIFKKKKKFESTFPENELERYLLEATSDFDAQSYFYQKLVWNQLLVLTPDQTDTKEGAHILGENETLKLVSFENGQVPIFTSLNRIFDNDIVQDKVAYISLKGQDLFGMTKGATFILNPYSEYSKELTSEEIANLMDGTIYAKLDAEEKERKKIEVFSKHYELACEKQKGLILLDGYRMQKLNAEETQRLEESIVYFKQGLALINDHWPSMVLMAKSFQRLERHAEALEQLELALTIELENHSIPMEASLEAIHLKDINKALLYSAESLKRKPNDFALMGNHAMNLLHAEKDKEAQIIIEQAIELEPRDEVNKNVKTLIEEVISGKRKRPTMEETVE
ncbi:SseB family protein [Myroides odoratus]|uniref:SseB family protein n=1 Tax=Myroides odoratus TaxID=256 RepID=UPI0039AFFA1A